MCKMDKIYPFNFLIVLFLLIEFNIEAQMYDKEYINTIRLMTYNTHYCKGGSDPGKIDMNNTRKLAQVIKALDADVVALQELDSASRGREYRYLLKQIADATGIEYIDIYGNADTFDHGASLGCGVLVKKTIPIKNRKLIPLPGDEKRVAVYVELEDFVFVGTHFDLNDMKRIEGAKELCRYVREESKPVFLAGDLNDSHYWKSGGIAFPILLEDFEIISDVEGGSLSGRSDNGGLIDYVLLKRNSSRGIQVRQSCIVRELSIDGAGVDMGMLSDHYPVFVDVNIKGSRK